MAVRNFWIECEIAGRKTRLHGGPQGKFGGLTLLVYQRVKGRIEKVCTIECEASCVTPDTLRTRVEVTNGKVQSFVSLR